MSENLIVFEQNQLFVNYVNEMLKVNFQLADCRTVSHIRKNDDNTYTILAVVVFNNWNVTYVEASIASSTSRWATWNYIHACYEYAFTKERTRINFVVETSNEDAIRMHKKLGHTCEGLLHDLFGNDKDAYVYGMTKRNYQKSKWYKRNNLRHK